MPDHYFSKEIFPNTQSKPPLTQLEANFLTTGFDIVAIVKSL